MANQQTKIEKALGIVARANIPPLVKNEISKALIAEGNPDSERLDVQVAQLPKRRRKLIEAGAKSLRKLERQQYQRIRSEMEAIKDFDELVEKAAQDLDSGS